LADSGDGPVFAPSVSSYPGPMSRWDSETWAPATTEAADPTALEVTTARDVPLGGLRAMTVRRTLPNRSRTTIGPWCFIDHYGPDDVADTGGMSVPPHPHTGLQTVSWLFDGEVQHRDSTGVEATVAPGSINLMNAGAGISHSEVSTSTGLLHGVQLWLVLPDSSRHEPAFFAAEQIDKHQQGDGHLQVFLGSLQGISSSIPPAWPGVGAEFSLDPQGTMTLSVENDYEHAVLLDAGALTINGEALNQHELGYLAPGHHQIELSNTTDLPARGLLLGGQPFEEEFVMWWNFIGRSHEEIEEFRNQWQASLSGERGPFGNLTHMSPLPAPEMPGIRLKARNRR